ncbi:nucleotidyltransferase domain-containing protein [Acidocella aminolytica]|uniref:Nucleotidyltransferase n=1 Tax=Acidocella aminolytica 101 = DSM 11237 TaxID=1120923 RepID=A0A0D6PAT3_9PROT|nr:nucleotidyltransferase [Acidocella aminolytica]GAN78762.1 hypothetical protein Aam_007_049 [Acidocella aminolytica 101 = DSM 11237]SHE79449.1 hypothetical protein SAMN02746095_01223 [Acidocella aminolytica 101 = DSM 11237]
MNALTRDSSNHILDEGDVLLADVAVRIQLPPSSYAIAEGRYNTLANWIERDGSPLQGLVGLVYGQGGVATGSVVANRASNDEYDVDAIIGLSIQPNSDPQLVLDTLYDSVRGEPGSRYYNVTTRCTRCVQVAYADSMHVDLTPAVLLQGRPDRESIIFHHRAETPHIAGRHIIANPYGFADWFKANTPPEPLFGQVFGGYIVMDRALEKAQTEPLPDQLKPHETSRALLSLQLTKRFRNLRYNDRDHRCPPSVLLCRLIAEHKVFKSGFAVALLSHVTYIRDEFRAAQQAKQLYYAVNPVCPTDVLTDRWPGSLADQGLWCRDLNHYVDQLTVYVHGSPTLAQRQAILADLFGEQAARSAVRDFADRMGKDKEAGRSRYTPGTGRLVVPAAPALLAPTRGRTEPRTNYFGGDAWWRT